MTKTFMRQPEESEHRIFADMKALPFVFVGVTVVKKKSLFFFESYTKIFAKETVDVWNVLQSIWDEGRREGRRDRMRSAKRWDCWRWVVGSWGLLYRRPHACVQRFS